ncbi:hypothetical protein Pelo_4218 [Pelomyxa schiedti]|nr:hypothetical protein Pelo_4218 [Pelomyxa schiedti]
MTKHQSQVGRVHPGQHKRLASDSIPRPQHRILPQNTQPVTHAPQCLDHPATVPAGRNVPYPRYGSFAVENSPRSTQLPDESGGRPQPRANVSHYLGKFFASSASRIITANHALMAAMWGELVVRGMQEFAVVVEGSTIAVCGRGGGGCGGPGTAGRALVAVCFGVSPVMLEITHRVRMYAPPYDAPFSYFWVAPDLCVTVGQLWGMAMSWSVTSNRPGFRGRLITRRFRYSGAFDANCKWMILCSGAEDNPVGDHFKKKGSFSIYFLNSVSNEVKVPLIWPDAIAERHVMKIYLNKADCVDECLVVLVSYTHDIFFILIDVAKSYQTKRMSVIASATGRLPFPFQVTGALSMRKKCSGDPVFFLSVGHVTAIKGFNSVYMFDSETGVAILLADGCLG